MHSKRLVINALLVALALGIYVAESQLPPLVPVPGIKLGLSNIVTLFALIFLTPKDALLILLARVFLGTLFTGTPSMLFYSLSGGFVCFFLEALLLKCGKESYLWGVSALGAWAHNTVQLLVAAWITKTTAVFSYLPFLWISGILTGLFTGFCVFFLVKKQGDRLRKLLKP